MKGYYEDEHRYDDIIGLPHHRSATRPHMSLRDRAAQFAPFAALSGHQEVIEETGRMTRERMEQEGNLGRTPGKRAEGETDYE